MKEYEEFEYYQWFMSVEWREMYIQECKGFYYFVNGEEGPIGKQERVLQCPII